MFRNYMQSRLYRILGWSVILLAVAALGLFASQNVIVVLCMIAIVFGAVVSIITGMIP